MPDEDKDGITIPNVQFVMGPISPTKMGAAGLAPGSLKEVYNALVEKFGKEKADASWPSLEHMLTGVIQQVAGGQPIRETPAIVGATLPQEQGHWVGKIQF